MKLTFAMIIDKVLKELDVEPVFLKLSDRNSAVSGIAFNNNTYEDQNLIYVFAEGLPQTFPTNCIIIGEAVDVRGIPGDSSVLVLPKKMDRSRVVQVLNTCFIAYQQWKDQLLDMITDGRDWFSILEHLHAITQNPMIIYNSSMEILAYTRTDGSEDALWQDTIASGRAMVSNVDEADEFLKYVHLFETQNRPFKHQTPIMTDPFYSCNILIGEERTGIVTLIERNHTVTRGELDLLTLFSSIAALKIQMTSGSRQAENHFPEFISDLLTGSIQHQRQLSARLLTLGWDVQNRFIVLLFKKSISYLTGTQWRLALETYDTMGLNSVFCMLQEADPVLCAIVTINDSSLPARCADKIKQYCETCHLCCGISDVFDDLLQMSRYWEQASSSLALAEGTLRRYSEVRGRKLLMQLNTAAYPMDLLSPIVLQLHELDRVEETNYCETLEVLCRCKFHQSESAKTLGIHRTTLNYRLQKIEELTGLDLDNADQLLHAWASLAILHMHQS